MMEDDLILDESLSARRAWIEMLICLMPGIVSPSLSARRAWIEMLCLRLMFWLYRVALRKESVDRNFVWCIIKL